jgi:hypothetical protein
VGRARRSCLASAYRHRVNCERSLAHPAACDCGHPNRRRSAQGWDQRVGVPAGEIARLQVAVRDARRRGSTNQHEADDRSRRLPLRATLGHAGNRACRIRNPRRDESVHLRLVGFRGATQTPIEINPTVYRLRQYSVGRQDLLARCFGVAWSIREPSPQRDDCRAGSPTCGQNKRCRQRVDHRRIIREIRPPRP